MRITIDQLSGQLKKSLANIYLLAGDEPLQLAEAADDIRQVAKQSGYLHREVISIDKGTEWPQLREASESLSIFSDNKLIDLRLPSAKPGLDGSKILQNYCQNPPENTILLISSGKIESAATKSQWYQALDKVAVIVNVWPLQGSALIDWLQRRATRRGMLIEPEALKMLAMRIEGNLLAAAQELEKLYILHGQTRITQAVIEAEVASSARFDVFMLTDTLLAGQLNRAVLILQGLKAEGIAAPVIVWALSREARMLYTLKTKSAQGSALDTLFKNFNIWDKRKHIVQTAMARLKESDLQAILQLCAKTDQQIKGQLAGDAWEGLWHICLRFVKTGLVII